MLNKNLRFLRVKEGDKTDEITIRMIIDQEIDLLVEIEVHLIKIEEVLAEIIDQITEVDCGDNFGNDYRQDNYGRDYI